MVAATVICTRAHLRRLRARHHIILRRCACLSRFLRTAYCCTLLRCMRASALVSRKRSGRRREKSFCAMW